MISVHGGDVLGVAERFKGGRDGGRRARSRPRGSRSPTRQAIAERSRALGARDVRVVHLGTDVPPPTRRGTHVVTVGNLIARKRHADVLHALALLPGTRYVVVGDGPERPALERLAAELGVSASSSAARSRRRRPSKPPAAPASFVLPSTEEAFGVAYIEAMAGGVPAIGTQGEPGPEEIAASGGGMRLVPPHDPPALAHACRDALCADDGAAARANVDRQLHLEAVRRGHARRLRGRAAVTKPVLFVTNHAPPFRVGAFRALHDARASSSR